MAIDDLLKELENPSAVSWYEIMQKAAASLRAQQDEIEELAYIIRGLESSLYDLFDS